MDVAEFEELKRLPFIIDQLEAIQELHKPIYEDGDPVGCLRCDWESDGKFPCATRRLADEALNTN